MGTKKQREAISDAMGVQGFFLIEVIRNNERGVPKVIKRITTPNTVVNVGKKQLLRKAVDLNTKPFKFIRAGQNSAAVTSADTNVKTAITGTLKTVDSVTMSGRTLQIVYSYPSGAGTKSATFKEVAILNQHTSPGGSALARALLSPTATKTTADKLKITYQVRVT